MFGQTAIVYDIILDDETQMSGELNERLLHECLKLAMSGQHADTINMLLVWIARGKEITNEQVNLTISEGLTSASQRGNLDVVKVLVEYSNQNMEKWACHHAAENFHPHIVRYFYQTRKMITQKLAGKYREKYKERNYKLFLTMTKPAAHPSNNNSARIDLQMRALEEGFSGLSLWQASSYLPAFDQLSVSQSPFLISPTVKRFECKFKVSL